MQHGDKAWRARFIVIKWRLIDANVENIYQRGEAEGTSPASRQRKKEGKRVEMSERGSEGEREGKMERSVEKREIEYRSRIRANDRRKFDE